jgi:hypothetical protein
MCKPSSIEIESTSSSVVPLVPPPGGLVTGREAAKRLAVAYSAITNYDFYVRVAKELEFDFGKHKQDKFETLRKYVQKKRDYKNYDFKKQQKKERKMKNKETKQ